MNTSNQSNLDAQPVKSNSDRIVWIDQLRSIAFLLVILGHISIPKDLQSWIYSFHMPLFFMISGLTINREKIISTPFSKYVIKQAKALLIPYFWMNFLVYPLWYYLFHVVGHTNVTVPAALKGIFAGSLLYPYTSGPTWFLLVLFLVNCLYALLLKLTKGNNIVLLCCMFVCQIIGYLDKGNPRIWHFNVTFTAVVLLFIGNSFMVWYKNSKFRNETKNLKYAAKVISLIILFTAVGFVSHYFNGRISMTANKFGKSLILFYITSIAFSAATAFICMHLPKISLVTYIGQNTLLYIGIHGILINLIQQSFPNIFIANKVTIFTFCLLFFIYVGLAPVIMFFKKFFPYTCGKSTVQSTGFGTILKTAIVAWCAAIPYYNIIHRLSFDLHNGFVIAVGSLLLILLSTLFVLIANRFCPVIFLEEKAVKEKT